MLKFKLGCYSSCLVWRSELWCCIPPICWVSGSHVDFWEDPRSEARVTFLSLQCCVLNDSVMFHGPLLISGGRTGRTACHFHESIVVGSCSVLSSKLWCRVPPRCWVLGAHVEFWRTHGPNGVSLSLVYSVGFWTIVLRSMGPCHF